MSDTDEAGYYEIALTNRQVVIAFIVLLVCMLTAFFAGVWAGKTGAPMSAANSQAASQTAEKAAKDDGLEEFKFFSESVKVPDLAEVVKEVRPETTLVEDVTGEPLPGGDDERPGAIDPAGSAGEDEAAPADDEAAPADDEAAPPGGGRRFAPEQPAAAANPAIPRATARPDAAPGELFIQVFSTRDQKQARKVLRDLLDGGYSAFLSPVEVDGAMMYRVRIGPFAERAKAQEIAARVKNLFKLDTWITAG